jgi:hypothetical protein
VLCDTVIIERDRDTIERKINTTVLLRPSRERETYTPSSSREIEREVSSREREMYTIVLLRPSRDNYIPSSSRERDTITIVLLRPSRENEVTSSSPTYCDVVLHIFQPSTSSCQPSFFRLDGFSSCCMPFSGSEGGPGV